MSESIQRYQQLTVWQKGMQLVKLIYLVTKALPHEELYGLSNQMRRAVISIPSNIAEGYQRGSDRELSYFLRIDPYIIEIDFLKIWKIRGKNH